MLVRKQDRLCCFWHCILLLHFSYWSHGWKKGCSLALSNFLIHVLWRWCRSICTCLCSLLFDHYVYKHQFHLFLKLLLYWIAAKLYLPKVSRSSGAAIDMWIKVLSTAVPLSLSHCLSFWRIWNKLVLSGQRTGGKHRVLHWAIGKRHW